MKDRSSENSSESTSRSHTPGGISFNGSVTFNAPMFDIHDNAHVYIAMPDTSGASPSPSGEQAGAEERREDVGKVASRPEVLRSARAEALLARLVKAGLVDEHWQPLSLSNPEKGVLASLLADRLEVDNLWQTFGTLWGMKSETLRSACNLGMGQRKTMAFMERVKGVMEDVK